MAGRGRGFVVVATSLAAFASTALYANMDTGPIAPTSFKQLNSSDLSRWWAIWHPRYTSPTWQEAGNVGGSIGAREFGRSAFSADVGERYLAVLMR